MGRCVEHPDRETAYMCMKHQIYLCDECLACRDPKIYCKHRTGCVIWYLSRERARQAASEAEENTPDQAEEGGGRKAHG